MKIMSFNVRNSSAPDGSHAWKYRKSTALAVTVEEFPDLLGLQEALAGRVVDLEEALGGLGEQG